MIEHLGDAMHDPIGARFRDKALAPNPTSANLLQSVGGIVFVYRGKAREGVEMIEKATHLDPCDPNYWHGVLGRECYATEAVREGGPKKY
jgi:predicted Zn-dependent protease